jgi:hypothetical protein
MLMRLLAGLFTIWENSEDEMAKFLPIFSLSILALSLKHATFQLILLSVYIVTLTLVMNRPSDSMLLLSFQLYWTGSRVFFLLSYFNSMYGLREGKERKALKSLKLMLLAATPHWEYSMVKRMCYTENQTVNATSKNDALSSIEL